MYKLDLIDRPEGRAGKKVTANYPVRWQLSAEALCFLAEIDTGDNNEKVVGLGWRLSKTDIWPDH